MAMFCVESDYEPDLDPAEPDLVPPLPPALPPQALTETQRYTEYFHCTQRDSHAVHYRGEGSLYSCTLQSCNCDVLHRRLFADSDKIPEGGNSTYILHLSGEMGQSL